MAHSPPDKPRPGAGEPAPRPDQADPRARTFYGRRQGRPLRAHRQHLLETLLPRLAIDLPSPGATLDPAGLFAEPIRDVWLEIGFGNGEHLIAQAEAHPDVGLIGCEPYLNGMAALLAVVEAKRLESRVRVYGDDALAVLRALPDASLGRAFLLFPDPWPKARHHRRRFIQPDSVAELARTLRPGGELRVASDDAPLIDWMLRHIRAHPAFAWTAQGPADWRVRPADWPATRYEAKRLHGPPAYLAFRRV
jgi:tRNA (guanine-N7-)-methyltransferase